MRQKTAALLLVLLMCALPLLSACSQQTENAAEDAPASQNGAAQSADPGSSADAEPDIPEIVTDDLPERNYDGAAFNIYTRSNTTHYAYLAEEMNGEVLNDAIYGRNLKTAERFNIAFTETVYSDEIMAQNNVQSGDDTFSLMNVRCTAADKMAQKGLCFDISSMEFINLGKPYWDDELTRMIAVGDRYFTAIGSANLTTIDFMNVMLFNKDLFAQYQFDDLYSTVREGRWTFDAFGTMASSVTMDLDGDGALNANDQWGVLGTAKFLHCAFLPAGGAWYVSKDAGNIPVFSMGTDEHFLSVFEKTFAVLNDNNAWYLTNDTTNEAVDYHNMFRNNQGLFLATIFYYIESLRDMDYDFGIVPFPKYDESQADYYSRISFYDASVIPVTVPSPEMSAIVLEALNCESFNSVVPAYKDIALKSKFARDEDSSAMIDVYLEHRIVDFGDSILVDSIRDTFVVAMFYNNNKDLASAVKSRSKVITKTIDKMIAAYQEIESSQEQGG